MQWLGFVIAFLVGAALTTRNASNARALTIVPVADEETAKREVNQADEIFAYSVMAEAVKRSVEGARFVAGLLLALGAVQGAVFAIYLDRTGRFGGWVVRPMEAALVLAAVAILGVAIVEEGPRAADFARDFQTSPSAVRRALIANFAKVAPRNDRIRQVMMLAFVASLLATILDLVAAAWGGAVQSSGGP